MNTTCKTHNIEKRLTPGGRYYCNLCSRISQQKHNYNRTKLRVIRNIEVRAFLNRKGLEVIARNQAA